MEPLKEAVKFMEESTQKIRSKIELHARKNADPAMHMGSECS